MEFILSYRKANSKDKEKVKEILKTEGDDKCLRVADKCFIVENNRIVKAAKVIGKQGEFYTIQTVGSCGAIRLKESRLFMTEEEANNHINGKRIIIDDKGNNDDIGFIDVFEGKCFK